MEKHSFSRSQNVPKIKTLFTLKIIEKGLDNTITNVENEA